MGFLLPVKQLNHQQTDITFVTNSNRFSLPTNSIKGLLMDVHLA